MNCRHLFMRCPQLDRLGRDLIEAYRAVEDREVFTFSCGLETSNKVTTIHEAIAQHRRICPICCPEIATGTPVRRTIQPTL